MEIKKASLIIVLCLVAVCHAVISDIEHGGNVLLTGDDFTEGTRKELRWYDGVNYVGFEAGALSGDQIWVLPTADGPAAQALLTDGAGALYFDSPVTFHAHNILSATHTDTLIDTVIRGDVFIGNSTPKWSRLALGANQKVFVSDGTDPSWGTVDISGGTNLTVTAPITLTADDIGITVLKDIVAGVGLSGGENDVLPGADADTTLTFDATELDAITWSDNANASNIWTFDVSGTDHTMTAGDGLMAFSGIVQAADFAKTGWPTTSGVTLSFDDASKVFMVTDGGSAYYYIDGVKYTLGEHKTVDLDDVAGGAVEGLWYIYFDGATLTASQTVWSFTDEDKALVAILYWDATNSKETFLGLEAHTFHMSGATHARLHYAGGARWETGLLVSDATGELINVSAGDFWDEDLNIAITDDDTPTALFEQILSPAQLPIYYRDGASAWRVYETNEKANATDAGYVSGGDLKYNKLNGTWAVVTVGAPSHVAYWVVATNDQTAPIALIMGQRTDVILANAKENNIFGGLDLTGLPFQEMVVLARLILKDTAAYTLEEVLDLRALSIGGNITSPLITQHAGLGGLAWSAAGHTIDTAFLPDGDDARDLGSTTAEWKDLYVDGVANIDSLVADTADINAGTVDAITSLTVANNIDIGNYTLTANSLVIDGTFTDGNYTFDTDGNVSGLGTVGCGAITTTGNLTFDITETTTFAESGFGFLGIYGATGNFTKLQLFSYDGTGSATSIEVFGLGDIAEATNYERMIIGWDATNSWYRIATNSKNDGSPRPLHFYVDGQDTGQLVLSTGGDVSTTGEVLVKDKLKFTQDDGNEFIDSLNDGYMDYGATAAHRFNADVDMAVNSDVTLSGTGHVTSGSEGFIVGTLTITDGTIDDTDGTITFGNTNLITTGNLDDGTYSNTPSQLATTTINFVMSGGGSAITTGLKGFLEVPAAGKLVAWTLLADQSGTITVDVWKDTYANYPPTDADSITNGHEPEIAGPTNKAQDLDITDWSGEDSVAAGDIIGFNVDACATITQCTISLKFIKDNA